MGEEYSLKQAQFLGTYQHFYKDNFSEDDFSTHYVVLGYELELDIELSSLPDEQHNQYQWWEVESLLESEQVHINTKAYFSDKYK